MSDRIEVKVTIWPGTIRATDKEVAFQVEKLRAMGCVQVNYEQIDDFNARLVGYLPPEGL